MREDIVGMLKNAVERGGRPEQVAQSLINSGYNASEVQQALSFITGGTLSSLNSPPQNYQSQIAPMNILPRVQTPLAPTPPQQYSQSPYQQYARPLPTMQPASSQGAGKLILLIFVLLILVGGLITTIIFKDKILDFFG